MSSTWWICGFMTTARRWSRDATTSSTLQLIWVVSWTSTLCIELGWPRRCVDHIADKPERLLYSPDHANFVFDEGFGTLQAWASSRATTLSSCTTTP